MVGEISDFRLMIMVKICQWAVVVKKVTIKVDQTEAFRGSKSRNKVSVGEPAEGSL